MAVDGLARSRSTATKCLRVQGGGKGTGSTSRGAESGGRERKRRAAREDRCVIGSCWGREKQKRIEEKIDKVHVLRSNVSRSRLTLRAQSAFRAGLRRFLPKDRIIFLLSPLISMNPEKDNLVIGRQHLNRQVRHRKRNHFDCFVLLRTSDSTSKSLCRN